MDDFKDFVDLVEAVKTHGLCCCGNFREIVGYALKTSLLSGSLLVH